MGKARVSIKKSGIIGRNMVNGIFDEEGMKVFQNTPNQYFNTRYHRTGRLRKGRTKSLKNIGWSWELM